MPATPVRDELDETPFARLQHEGRILNAVFKGRTTKPRRVGFRGELALRFAPRSPTRRGRPNCVANRQWRWPTRVIRTCRSSPAGS